MKKFLMLLCVVAMVLFIAQMNYAQNESSIDAIDSLDVICQDSIQEFDKTDNLNEINKQLSIENFLKLTETIGNDEYAQKCGLSFVYKENDVCDCKYRYVYGRSVAKGDKIECGYDIISESNHAFYMIYDESEKGNRLVTLKFINSDDADLFFNKANEYGLLIEKDIFGTSYYMPKVKLPNGSRTVEEVNDYLFRMDVLQDFGEWYIILMYYK